MNFVNDEDATIALTAQIWFVILSGVYGLVALYVLFIQQRFIAGCICLILSRYLVPKAFKPAALFIAHCQIPIVRSIRNSANQAAIERKKRKEAKTEAERSRQEKLKVFRELIIRRLAMIDKSLVAYEEENDSLNRSLILETAQEQIDELLAKRVSGEIPPHVLTETEILAHANATNDHLVRIGLGESRLHEKICRLFNNFQTAEAPPTPAELKGKQAEALRVKLKSQAEALRPHVERAQDTIADQVRKQTSAIGNTNVQGAITRLAAVDTCLRRWEVETDPSKRTEWFDKAHEEITALEKQKAVGKIAASVLTNPGVVEHAKATTDHLVRIGMGHDRLHEDIVRLFR